MALNPVAYAAILLGDLQASSFVVNSNTYFIDGPELPILCTAVATGVITTILTLQGQITGGLLTGPSTGLGIHFLDTDVATNFVDKAKLLFNTTGGPALQPFGNALGLSLQTYLSIAVLTSDTNGTAHFPSFSSAITTMASAIQSASVFTGAQWPNMCEAIAYGICTTIGSNGTGTLTGSTLAGTGTGVVIIT